MYKAVKKPWLNARMKRIRFYWVNCIKNWTFENFKKICLSDKSSSEILGKTPVIPSKCW